MAVSNVSFGSVVAISGKPGKINKVNNKMYMQSRLGNVMIKDVTSHYKKSSNFGLLAESAQKGDKVEIYITGADVAKVKDKQKSWDTLDGILSNMTTYFNIDKMSINEVVDRIFRS